MIWKGIFDAKHRFGTYYGRVAFVHADDRAEALTALTTAALVEFPNHDIIAIGIGQSTEAAETAHLKARQATADWQRKNRARQHLLCPACNGTGLAAEAPRVSESGG